MKKTIIKSTFYLILVSVIAKILSFSVRILLARSLSADAMNLYALASPTMVFIITLAQMGIPGALSKVIAERDHPHEPVKSCILISVINNLLISCLFLLLIPLLSHYILKQDAIEPVLYAILPLIPMVTLSGILKGYLFGIQRHLSATACQLFEEGTRIIYLFIVFTFYPPVDIVAAARIAMLSVTIGEMGSSVFMLILLRRKIHPTLQLSHLFADLHKSSFDEVLAVSIPMTGSRLIGSLTYFLEPILMVMGLSQAGAAGMINAYGQLNGYVLPILTMPSFITVTLSNYLLPSFTYHYTRKNHKTAARLFGVIVTTCFLIGLLCSLICYRYNAELMQLFYHTERSAPLLKTLAWPFAFYALQPPLGSLLHALSRSHRTVIDTLLGSASRLLCVALLTPILHESSLAIGLTVGMIITTLLHAINVWRTLRDPA